MRLFYFLCAVGHESEAATWTCHGAQAAVNSLVLRTLLNEFLFKTRMWANAQRDGRPAEHRWRRLFNAAKFGWRPLGPTRCRAVTYQDAKPVEISWGALNYRIYLSR